MNLRIVCFCLLMGSLVSGSIFAQEFTRTRINVELENPWEIIYGPDDHLWISEKGGKVVRVEPESGEATLVYTAPDYFPGAASEKAPCGLSIGANTFGLALHPDFTNPANAFVYFIYSYNSGTTEVPATLFKIVQLTWDATSSSVVASKDLVTELANGYDHFGGRLIAVQQTGKYYLYYSTGDTGANIAGCYDAPADNPNNTTQDPYTKVGKIHRVNIDGTIPEDNPIPGNTFFTRGHRNPQGLAYHPRAEVIYAIEHGHTTDDEINILQAGMNYGWKDVQGYHDGNYAGELDYVQDYMPHPDIPNDRLVEPLFAWGTVPVEGGFLSWPTVAPSDGIFYGSHGIPEWTNSLLVVTLKNGDNTYQEVFQFKLTEDGKGLVPSTAERPNPRPYFREDQFFNGRLRDIAVSPDGKTLFLITNNRQANDPIIVYTYQDVTATPTITDRDHTLRQNVPNPFSDVTVIQAYLKRSGHLRVEVTDLMGRSVKTLIKDWLPAGDHSITWNGQNEKGIPMPNGVYIYRAFFNHTSTSAKMILAK